MSDNKVVLPREVVDAIDHARNEGKNNADILFDIHEGDSSRVIHDYINHVGTFDKLLSALVNGYTAEASPEEKVREYYEDYETSVEQALSIEKTLNLLGITIEGVNA